MGDEKTASTLALVAGILQIIFSMIFVVIGILVVGIMMGPFVYDPYLSSLAWFVILIPLVIFGVFGIIGLIIGIMWFNWRHNPNEHKTGLIVTGILAMIFSIGFVPGILALIAGAITPSPSEYRPYEQVKTPTVRVIVRCRHCGADLTSKDRFCWKCGAQQ